MTTDPGGSRVIVKGVALAATAAVCGAVAYHYLKKKPFSSKAASNLDEMQQMKEQGNKFFTQKQYRDAIAYFDKVIALGEGGGKEVRELVAICYQNRAASKQLSGDYEVEDCIQDCTAAMQMNPRYARAYARRAVLLKGINNNKQALADIFACSHLNSAMGDTLTEQATEILEELTKEFQSEIRQNALALSAEPLPVTQEQIYGWLYTTVSNEAIQELYFEWEINQTIETPFEKALESIHRRDYESAALFCRWEEGEYLLEASILVARLLLYQGQLDLFHEELRRFDSRIRQLSREEQEAKAGLVRSATLLRIQAADTPANLERLVEPARDKYPDDTDVYVTAAHRLIQLNDYYRALDYITYEYPPTDKSHKKEIRNFSVQVLIKFYYGRVLTQLIHLALIVNKLTAPPNLYNHIYKLEEIVNRNGEENAEDWMLFTMCKVYLLFNEHDACARVLQVLGRRNVDWSMYYVSLASNYTQTEHFKEALEAVDHALEAERINMEAIIIKASLLNYQSGNSIMEKQFYTDLMDLITPAVERCRGTADHPFVADVIRLKATILAKLDAGYQIGLYSGVADE